MEGPAIIPRYFKYQQDINQVEHTSCSFVTDKVAQ